MLLASDPLWFLYRNHLPPSSRWYSKRYLVVYSWPLKQFTIRRLFTLTIKAKVLKWHNSQFTNTTKSLKPPASVCISPLTHVQVPKWRKESSWFWNGSYLLRKVLHRTLTVLLRVLFRLQTPNTGCFLSFWSHVLQVDNVHWVRLSKSVDNITSLTSFTALNCHHLGL